MSCDMQEKISNAVTSIEELLVWAERELIPFFSNVNKTLAPVEDTILDRNDESQTRLAYDLANVCFLILLLSLVIVSIILKSFFYVFENILFILMHYFYKAAYFPSFLCSYIYLVKQFLNMPF